MFRIVLILVIMLSHASSQDYRWPIRASQSLSATFCEYRDGHLHAGIDIKTWGEMEVPCLAITDGYIEGIVVGYNGYGRGLFLRLKDGNRAIYGHLEQFTKELESRVQAAQEENQKYYTRLRFDPDEFPVRAGDVIGYSGTSGTEHPHLHFEIRDSSNLVHNPQMFYKGIRDSRRPVLDEIMLIPRDADSRVNLSRFPVRIDVEDNENPITTSGSFYSLINAHDRANGTYNKYSLYRADVFLNDSLTFAYRFDELPHELYDSVEVVYPGVRGKRKWRFMSMFKIGDTEGFPFIKDGLTGVIEPDRISTLRYRLSDVKRNVVSHEFVLNPGVLDNWRIEDNETHYLVTRSYPENGYERFQFYSGDNAHIPVAQTFYRLNSTSWMIIKSRAFNGIRALGTRGVGLKWVLPPPASRVPDLSTQWVAYEDGYVLRLESDSSYTYPLSYKLIANDQEFNGELVQVSETSAESDVIPLLFRALGNQLHLTVDQTSVYSLELSPLIPLLPGDSIQMSLDEPEVELNARNVGPETIYLDLDTLNAEFEERIVYGATVHSIYTDRNDLQGELTFNHPGQPGNWSLFTPAKRGQWKRLSSIDTLSQSSIPLNGNGRYFLLSDVEAPRFDPLKRYQRVKHGDRLVFKLEDNTKRFPYRRSLESATLDGNKFYPDYNPLRHELSFHVPNNLNSGTHTFRITLFDHSNNSMDYSYQFQVTP